MDTRSATLFDVAISETEKLTSRRVSIAAIMLIWVKESQDSVSSFLVFAETSLRGSPAVAATISATSIWMVSFMNIDVGV